MNLFDSHSHYNDKKFDLDREEIIKETLSNGVSNFIVAGYNVESSKKAIEIAEKYEEVYAIVGISPNDVEDIKTNIEESILKIEQIAINKKVVALHRSKIGNIHVKDVKLGSWRYLKQEEVRTLLNYKG